MVAVEVGVLELAFEHLRGCGEGQRECVVYLTGPVDERRRIDGVVHPVHAASAVGYEVGTKALGELSAGLLVERRSVRAQMHTHPGAAYHSSIDDGGALLGTPGFLSIVIPDFALGPVGLAGAFLAELTREGTWEALDIATRLEVRR
ncbi:MAG TPA: hypothetical protein VMB05_11415 [Solirubrobacteraceae bacterium]|nr:hypothetical protein [Solirubrobacteraceae bacterium]